jgi:hypothetical protein
VSYIDTFDHEFVGYFGDLPIYHPRADIDASPDDPADFGCGPGQPVIGGGGGEHPDSSSRTPSNAATRFLMHWVDWLEDARPDDFAIRKPAFTVWEDRLRAETLRPSSELFEFSGWSAVCFADFYARYTSAAFSNPYRTGRGPLEAWLAGSLGQFVLFCLPELCPRTLASSPILARWSTNPSTRTSLSAPGLSARLREADPRG